MGSRLAIVDSLEIFGVAGCGIVAFWLQMMLHLHLGLILNERSDTSRKLFFGSVSFIRLSTE